MKLKPRFKIEIAVKQYNPYEQKAKDFSFFEKKLRETTNLLDSPFFEKL